MWQAGQFFDRVDKDKSGQIDFKELNKMFRSEAEIDPKLKAGGAGEIVLTAENKVDINERAAARKAEKERLDKGGGFVTKEGSEFASEEEVAKHVVSVLAKDLPRVIDLFKTWDTEGDGLVSKKEFKRALAELGLAITSKQVQEQPWLI